MAYNYFVLLKEPFSIWFQKSFKNSFKHPAEWVQTHTWYVIWMSQLLHYEQFSEYNLKNIMKLMTVDSLYFQGKEIVMQYTKISDQSLLMSN